MNTENIKEGAKKIPLESLFSKREKIEFNYNQTSYVFDVVKPSTITISKITKMAELAKAQAKTDPDNQAICQSEAQTADLDQIIETLASIKASQDAIKIAEKLKEKHKDIDEMFELSRDENLPKETKAEVTKKIDAYLKDYDKEYDALVKAKKVALSKVDEATLRNNLFKELLEAKGLAAAMQKTKEAMIVECLYYPDSNEQVFTDYSQLANLDDAVFDYLASQIDVLVSKKGVDLKKVPLAESLG